MIFGIILAGGTGSRMKTGNFPKQFMDLAGKPIIIHTLNTYLSYEGFDKIYLGIHPDWVDYMKELVSEHTPGYRHKITIIPGGKDRNSSLFNVIEDIVKNYGEEDHFISTHDAVRPFVTADMIIRGIENAEKYGACATVVPATDTVVVSESGENIDSVPDRKTMYLQQTPQSFELKKLRDLYYSLSEEQKNILTDACGIFNYKGEYVHMTMGDVTNIKITTAPDLSVGEVFMKLKDDR